MKNILFLGLCALCVSLSCTSNNDTSEVTSLEKEREELNEVLNTIGIKKKFLFDILYQKEHEYELDWTRMSVCQTNIIDRDVIQKHVKQNVPSVSTFGEWKVCDIGFSFNPSRKYVGSGYYVKVDFCANTGILIIEEHKI